MKAEFYVKGTRVWFDDLDVVNPEFYMQPQESNPNGVRPWLIYNVDSPVCIVFASNEQDAWDEAADAGKLDGWLLTEDDVTDEDEVTRLGNASEPYYIDSYLIAFEIPNPPFSFAALVNAVNVKQEAQC